MSEGCCPRRSHRRRRLCCRTERRQRRRRLNVTSGRSPSLYRERPTSNPTSAPAPPKSPNLLGRTARVHPKYCCHHLNHHTFYHTSQPIPSAQHNHHYISHTSQPLPQHTHHVAPHSSPGWATDSGPCLQRCGSFGGLQWGKLVGNLLQRSSSCWFCQPQHQQPTA